MCYLFLSFFFFPPPFSLKDDSCPRPPPPASPLTTHLSPLLTQLEQFNMMETAVSSDSLYNQTSTLNYSQALMMDLTGGHCNLTESPQLAYSSHGNIPNIILTGARLPLAAVAHFGLRSRGCGRVRSPVKAVTDTVPLLYFLYEKLMSFIT